MYSAVALHCTALHWDDDRMISSASHHIAPAGVVLGMPCNKFCAELMWLTKDSVLSASATSTLLDLFGPDLVTYSLAFLAMGLNLLYLQR